MSEPKPKIDGKRDKSKGLKNVIPDEIKYEGYEKPFDVIEIGRKYSIYNEQMPQDGGYIIEKKKDDKNE